MATHTPGPITVERVNNEHSSRAGDGRTHPRVNGWRCSMAEYEHAPEEHEANATLYAAAPDLLAACEALVEARRKWRSQDETETIDSVEYLDMLDAIDFDTAIAKAHGK
jgi:hypothetical protein